MQQPLRFVVMFGVALSLMAGLHYWFWARLVRDTALPQPWRTVATALLIVLCVSMPTAMVLARAGSRFGRVLAWPAFVWMGVLVYLGLMLLGTEVVHLVARLGGHLDAVDGDGSARRVALRRLLGAAAATVTAGVSAAAARIALGPVAVKQVEVRLDRLPRALDGTTIVQLSDVHVGPTIGRRFIEELVRRTNALAPDVVAITGDLVDGDVEQLRDAVAPLAGLKAKHGVYFVTGNHEYYSGADPWIAELRRLGVRVLRNERVVVGDGAASFDLAGVDDASSHRMGGGHGEDVAGALAGRDPSRECVLLAHQPVTIARAAAHGVGLQLSGHTHGGQLWPWGYLVRLQQPYVAGLVRQGQTQLYVSSGTGYWGPPMRLGAPAEITRLVLRAA